MLSPVEELLFWTGIMRDHGEFLLTALSSREMETIQQVDNFYNQFINLRAEAQSLIGTDDDQAAVDLATRVRPVLIEFINLKRGILRRLLECNIEVNFPPSFINHMINEAMEFLRTLDKILNTDMTVNLITALLENLRLHRIWLPDAAGHAASIKDALDPVETELIKEAEIFKMTFNELTIKANELSQILPRAGLMDGNLEYFNKEVIKNIFGFISYLKKLMDLRLECKAMGTLKPLMANHMIREENYYLVSLSSYTQIFTKV